MKFIKTSNLVLNPLAIKAIAYKYGGGDPAMVYFETEGMKLLKIENVSEVNNLLIEKFGFIKVSPRFVETLPEIRKAKNLLIEKISFVEVACFLFNPKFVLALEVVDSEGSTLFLANSLKISLEQSAAEALINQLDVFSVSSPEITEGGENEP